jgi:hypothetical protein
VKEAAVGLEAVELWKPGPLVERDGKLIREDIGEDSLPRAEELLKHSRKASPREWGDGRAYRMSFLTLHGGPLVTLSRGPLKVKVAPFLTGRIRQITYDGKGLLHLGKPGEKGYPHVGGAFEKLNPGARLFTIVGTPSATSATMQAELGIAHWGSNTKQVATKTVAITEDGLIKITGRVKQVDRRHKTIAVALVTTYWAGEDLDRISVEYLDGEAQWKKAQIATQTGEAKLAATQALRVRLPHAGCMVTDRCVFPEATAAQLSVDRKKGTLTTLVTTRPVDVPRDQQVRFLAREMEVVPIGEH